MKNLQVDSLRKLLLSTVQDARVITVKICDRMHNVSTLEYLRADKAKRIAKETLEIYYPILHLMSL